VVGIRNAGKISGAESLLDCQVGEEARENGKVSDSKKTTTGREEGVQMNYVGERGQMN